MAKLEIEIHDDLITVVEKMRNFSDTVVELFIPEGSVLFENSLSIKLIKKEAEKLGKEINIETDDPVGLLLLGVIQESGEISQHRADEDFVAREIPIGGSPEEKVHGSAKKRVKKSKMGGVKFKMPVFSFPKKRITFILGGVLVGVLLLVFLGNSKAEIRAKVDSQPLIKSVEFEVGVDQRDSAEERTLQGKNYTASVIKSKTGETTGTKLVGEKASGKITIQNKTLIEKDLDSGEELFVRDDEDKDPKFVLDDDVTVPAAVDGVDSDGFAVRIFGTAEVEVVAKDIGSDGNIDDNTKLEFEDLSYSDFAAVAEEDFEGGKSETVKVVAKADMDKLAADLLPEVQAESDGALSKVVESGWVLVEGSGTASGISSQYDKKEGDEAEELTVTQSASVSGLAYNQKELESLLDSLIEEFTPRGFELLNNEKEIKIEILGNTDSTVLNSTNADLQVTLKAYVIPQVNEEALKESLKGKSAKDAAKILDEVQNINSYEINLDTKIPILGRIPRKVENITLILERE